MAHLGSVTRKDVDMLTPETLRTMIGVPIALHKKAAVSAIEVFDCTLELK